MAIAGSWLAGTVTPAEYTGALRWGTGINPVHAIPDPGTRTAGIKENLLPLGTDTEGGAVPEALLGPEAWGYSSEEAALYPGEDYRYLDDHPNWGDQTPRDQDSLGAGPVGTQEWPPWGPHGADPGEPAFPLAGWSGGETMRAVSEGAEVENARAIAVPTRGWRGGWLNKAHGAVEQAETSDPSQYEITTSMVQLDKTRVNDAAVTRQTDDPRAPIKTRLTGQKEKHYARSAGMGGGPATPDMGQQPQDLPYRPWFFRQAATPPPPDTMFGTITYFEPIERTVPTDAGELVTVQEAPPGDGSYGYTEGDYVG